MGAGEAAGGAAAAVPSTSREGQHLLGCCKQRQTSAARSGLLAIIAPSSTENPAALEARHNAAAGPRARQHEPGQSAQYAIRLLLKPLHQVRSGPRCPSRTPKRCETQQASLKEQSCLAAPRRFGRCNSPCPSVGGACSAAASSVLALASSLQPRAANWLSEERITMTHLGGVRPRRTGLFAALPLSRA